MSVPEQPADKRLSLARWSARKRDARLGRTDAVDGDAPARQDGVAADAAPAHAYSPPQPSDPDRTPPAAMPLPDVDALTFDSDFSAFMAKDVDADLRRAAVRKLLRDPRFNVMDGLDVYIDDYTREDPIPPSMLAQLQHAISTLSPVSPSATGASDAVARDSVAHDATGSDAGMSNASRQVAAGSVTTEAAAGDGGDGGEGGRVASTAPRAIDQSAAPAPPDDGSPARAAPDTEAGTRHAGARSAGRGAPVRES